MKLTSYICENCGAALDVVECGDKAEPVSIPIVCGRTRRRIVSVVVKVEPEVDLCKTCREWAKNEAVEQLKVLPAPDRGVIQSLDPIDRKRLEQMREAR
jgi:hypothetical protein